MTVVYLLGPALTFSAYAERVIQAGGVPVGGPLVAALPKEAARVARYGLLGQASVVFAMPGWRDEWESVDLFLQAEHEGKTILRDIQKLYAALDEEVRPEDWLEVGPRVLKPGRDFAFNRSGTRLGNGFAIPGGYGL